MRSTTHAPLASGPLAATSPQASLLPISPRTVKVWLTEPFALVKVTSAIGITEVGDVDAAQPSWTTSTAVHVAAQMLGKFPGSLTASIAPVDGGVVLVPLARFVDANAAAEAIGSVASLLGHATNPARLVLGTLYRDGVLGAHGADLNLATLPPSITAVAVAPGTRWQRGGRAVDVVEVGDLYQAYTFMTGITLPQVAMPTVDATPEPPMSHFFAQLAPLWPSVLVASHDHGAPHIRSVAMRSLAAARASEWSKRHGAISDATVWMREALILARALQVLIAEHVSAVSPQRVSASRAVETMRTKTMAEPLLPDQLAEEDGLRRELALLRWSAPPPGYPSFEAPPPSGAIAARFGMLHLLGATPPETLTRWWHQATGLLALAAPPSPADAAALRALHEAASHRLYQLAMLLDAHIAARVAELTLASSPARPSP